MDQMLCVESFGALSGLPVRHGFVGRVPGIDVVADRAVALARLDEHHRRFREQLGVGDRSLATAEQVHGNAVGVIGAGSIPAGPVPGKDALVTDRRDVCLGIYVADCGPLFLVDPVREIIGLAHSGRKGTELNIAAATIAAMHEDLGSEPADIVAQLGPCIRPPWYEADFAATIVKQCRAAGVRSVSDCGTCTAANPEMYYSYRREKGKTGRMVALLALA